MIKGNLIPYTTVSDFREYICLRKLEVEAEENNNQKKETRSSVEVVIRESLQLIIYQIKKLNIIQAYMKVSNYQYYADSV